MPEVKHGKAGNGNLQKRWQSVTLLIAKGLAEIGCLLLQRGKF